MTESKMIKVLFDLADKKSKDYGVFYLIDVWEQDPNKRVREIITIENLIEEFTKKEGRFYPKYKITSEFRELQKHIEKNEKQSIKCFYKDTYEAFMSKWKEEHPNEKDYKTWLEKERKKQQKNYRQMIETFGLFGSPYFNLKLSDIR